MAEAVTLAALGETELIRRLEAYAPPGQFNDDAALLQEHSDRVLVITSDVLVEGVHFSDATMAGGDLGWRAAAANLSDLAAMGCRSVVGLTVALVAPGSTPWSWVEGVYGGLGQALERYGGQLLGGDCSAGGQRALAITALGHLGPMGPIRRGDGRAGDQLVSTGDHGLSRLGLALLLGETSEGSLAGHQCARAIQAHRRPMPRFDAVQALERSRPPQQSWRVGGTDSSDGLAAAVALLARGSGCTALLERGALPIDPALEPLPQADRWCLGGGEDFELVLALPPAWCEAFLAALPGSAAIGRLAAGPVGVIWADTGEVLGADLGYSHFNVD
ncbi:thiamine-phosphate kinase [Cyanobium sp. Morenito 9A2]|uniref:thiamine-phosphate kinase n=1 Tax=Cyanobium sp. Morenito 9A2 TaxID=2823718 RepID=UPI0020CEB8A6|nr:thiamine-phosphate kinase [Cyanobium sp. Morenito 9A2]MCP9850289.1 thiamine-phosphate kinase [Cyanobium sp. Morenito 9A2]